MTGDAVIPAALIGRIAARHFLNQAIVEQTSITRFADRTDGRHRRKGAVGDWRTALSADDVALIEREAGDLLRRVGYV